MPFKLFHSCLIDSTVVMNLVTREVFTESFGRIQVTLGETVDGVKKTRSIRIPYSVPVHNAYEICRLRGGEFTPATPANPQLQLLSDWNIKCLKREQQKEIYLALIRDYDEKVSPKEDLEFYKKELRRLEL